MRVCAAAAAPPLAAAEALDAVRAAFHVRSSCGADGGLKVYVVLEEPQRPSRTTLAFVMATIASSGKSRAAASRHSVSLTLPEESSRMMTFFATVAPAGVLVRGTNCERGS